MAGMLLLGFSSVAADLGRNVSKPIELGNLPRRVHVFEDYETEIEKRWWLRGLPETNNVAPSLSLSIPNRRACRAIATKDFDDKMEDPGKNYKAVVNLKTGRPWIRVGLRGQRPLSEINRLRFRYRLVGAGKINVLLANSRSGKEWQSAMTRAKSGNWAETTIDFKTGKAGEFADELRFEVPKGAELFVDDVLLFEPGTSNPTTGLETGSLKTRESL